MFELIPRRYNTVRRINPYSIFNQMEDSFNDNKETVYGINTDIKETENGYMLEASLPGFKKEDITLEINKDVLVINAKKDQEVKEENNGYLRREINRGQFRRSFNVDGIKVEDINAKYENGILEVNLPKQEEKAKHNKLIEIQ